MSRNKSIYWFLQFVSWGGFCFLLGIAAIIQGTYTFSTFLHILKLYILLILLSHFMVLIKRDWLNLKMGVLIPKVIGLEVILALLLLLVNDFLN